MWEEHRAALASVLSFADWEQAVRAHTVAGWVSQFSREDDLALDEQQQILEVGAEEVSDAQTLLNEVSDGSRLTKAQKALFRATGGWLK
jgi:hypothetical protein